MEGISVMRIGNWFTLDQFQNPIQDGLSDQRMGISPYDYQGHCVTCGQTSGGCQGHPGYIRLQHMVFNHLFSKHLLNILRCICTQCKRIKLKGATLKEFKKKIVMASLGVGKYSEV